MDHKFQSVKGCSIREFLPDLPLKFLHDANAFLLGIPGSEYGRTGGITLGTGLGAAAAENGICINNDAMTPRYPLWNIPFHGGIAEDFISTRALLAAYPAAKTVKEMAELPETEMIWKEFGKNLAELLHQWQAVLALDKIYIGGGISRAKNRFLVPELEDLPIEFYTGDSPALEGVFKEFKTH
jgi:glucokinase